MSYHTKMEELKCCQRSVTVFARIISFATFLCANTSTVQSWEEPFTFVYWAQIARAPSMGSLSSSETRGFVFDMTREKP